MPLLSRLALAAALLLPAAARAAYDPAEPIAPIKAPFDMPQLQRPVFPARVIDIAERGATAGGEVKNTAVIAAAIAELDRLGGGRVLVPAGVWLTGPVHLRSNIELHLAEGAVLKFSDVIEDYLPNVFVRGGGIEFYNYSPLIYARGCENIGITGPGRLDGNARAWWDWKNRETREQFAMGAAGVPVGQRVFGTREAAIRPSFIGLIDCKNILLEGFTIGSGPNWTIHPVYSENIIIRRVNVATSGPNNDGIDPDSCRNVLIEHCTFSTGDDCVVLKSGYDEDGRRVGRPTENVVMRHSSSKRGHGGLVIGSEMSGSVRNVYMHDCDFEGTDRVLRIKSRPGRGGVVENVWVENVTARALKREVVILNMDYSSDPNPVADTHPPLFRNIHVGKVAASGAPVAIRITGMDTSLIRDLTFSDLALVSERGVIARFAENIAFERVAITHAKGPLFDLENVTGLTVDGRPVAPAAPPAAAPSIVLVGDSTVTDNAGWGLGFRQFLADDVRLTNTARGGRSSMSFIAEGSWEKALALRGDYYLIQFGHNDEPGKPGRSTTEEEYRGYMERYVDETRAAGAVPVLVTSLVRRQFKTPGDPHKITSSLQNRAGIVRSIAREKNVPLVELHDRSLELCEKLGREGCLVFSPTKEDGKYDGTHLNAEGYVLFGRLVAEELKRAVPALAPHILARPRDPHPVAVQPAPAG